MTTGGKTSLETRALQYLAKREYSRHELEQKLSVHEHSRQQVSDLLDQLERDGYLSTERFAEQTARIRRSRLGSQRIVRELKAKGVDEHIIADILPVLKDNDLETAWRIWQKKFGAPPVDPKARGKQIRFMMSRGFSSDTINTILSQADREET